MTQCSVGAGIPATGETMNQNISFFGILSIMFLLVLLSTMFVWLGWNFSLHTIFPETVPRITMVQSFFLSLLSHSLTSSVTSSSN